MKNTHIYIKETSLRAEAKDREGVCIPSPIRADECNIASLVAGAPFGLKAEVYTIKEGLIKLPVSQGLSDRYTVSGYRLSINPNIKISNFMCGRIITKAH